MSTPAFWGNQFLVNTTTEGSQDEPAITALADGRFVATWTDPGPGTSVDERIIRAKIFNADGSVHVEEFTVNTSAHDHFRSKVTALPDGHFVVIWTDTSASSGPNDDVNPSDIHGQVYSVDGKKIGDEFVVDKAGVDGSNHVIASNGGQDLPDIAAVGTNGEFVAVWHHDGGVNGTTDVRTSAFHYDAQGHLTQQSTESTVNMVTVDDQTQPVVMGTDDGGYIIAWLDYRNADGSTGLEIRARYYDPFGNATGETVLKSGIDYTSGSEDNGSLSADISMAKLSGGRFVVSWNDQGLGDGNAQVGGVHAQVFSVSDEGFIAHVGDEFAVAAVSPNGYQDQSSVTALNDGRFMIGWTNHDRSVTWGDDVYGQVFGIGTDDTIKPETPLLISTHGVDTLQNHQSVTTLLDGRVVVTWHDDGGLESGSGNLGSSIQAQIIDPRIKEVAVTGTGLDDDFHGTAWNDTLTGNDGNDNLHGAAGQDMLDGGRGNDTLDGGADADVLKGGAGDDVYFVTAGDTVTEAAKEGIDTVYSAITWTLDPNVENLVLTAAAWGYGNDLANSITGSNGNDVLFGWNDSGVSDTLVGGAGDDTYYVDASDIVNDTSGFDTVVTDASVVDASHFSGIEKIVSTNTNGATLNGDGLDNVLVGNAGSDVLNGGGGNDILDGGAGADVMTGGTRNDTYYVDNPGDQVVEQPGGGYDTVYASVSFSLGNSEVEVLTAVGAGNINLTGNAYDNTLTGNAGSNTLQGLDGNDVLKGLDGADMLFGGNGNDTLYGGYGNDTLSGGAGKDVFVFDAPLGTSTTDRKVNFDKITDFSVKDDSFYLDHAVFKKLGSGSLAHPKLLSKSSFVIGSKALDKNDYIIYDNKTGGLSYDADGSGHGKAVEFAQLAKNLHLTYKDFYVI